MPNPVRSEDLEVVTNYGVWTVGATGAVSSTPDVAGRGLTLARSAVGDYTVTVSNATGGVPAFLFANATINVQSDLDRLVVGKGYSTANGTWSFTVFDSVAATPTPIDPASGDTLMITVTFRNTSRA